MGELRPKEGERRRSPRFNCGGRATLYRLPFDGKSIPANLRNLSCGGLCVDVTQPVEPGARAEVVVCVNSVSFRAAALVRNQKETSGTSLQFVQLGTVAKEVLDDLLARLAKVQALNRKLRTARIDEDLEQMLSEERMLVEQKQFRAFVAGNCGVWVARERKGADSEAQVQGVQQEPEAKAEVVVPQLIEIDLFG